MRFEKDVGAQNAGFYVGYALAFLVFTTMLFLVLSFAHKSGNWSYWQVLAIVTSIAIVGLFLRRWLR